MLPDLNRLKVFHVVYANKTITEAASMLHITSSAISQTLQKLEAELGVALFIRMHKRLVPTAYADKLFRIIEPFLKSLETEVGNLLVGKEKPSGKLRIGAPVEFGKNYIPPLLSSFRRRYPDVRFVLELGSPATLIPMIEDGKLDFALVDEFIAVNSSASELPNYSIEPILNEEVVLVCARSYYEDRIRDDLSYEHMLEQDYVCYKENDVIIKKWFRHHFNRQPKALHPVLVVDNLYAVASAVKSGIGLGITSSHLVGKYLDDDTVIIRVAPTGLVNRILFVELCDKIPTLAEKEFKNHFMAEVLRMKFQPVT